MEKGIRTLAMQLPAGRLGGGRGRGGFRAHLVRTCFAPATALLIALLPATGLGGSLSGIVHAIDGPRIPDALVRVLAGHAKHGWNARCPTCWSEVGLEVRTNPDGSFTFDAVNDSARYDLFVDAISYEPTVEGDHDPAGPPSSIGVSPLDTLEGANPRSWTRVVDPDGHPVAGAFVQFRCEPQPGERGDGAIYPGSYTNRDGRAINWPCWPGARVVLDVGATGFATREERFALPESAYAVTLGRGAGMVGRVVRDGQPLVDVPVKLLRAQSPLIGRGLDGETLTDARGEYRFDHVTSGLRYWVFVPLAAAPAWGAFRAESVTAGGEGSVVRFPEMRCRKGRTLSGRIVLPAGGHLAGRYLRLRILRTIGEEEVWHGEVADKFGAAVDTNGVFSFRAIPEEKMRIEAYVPGFDLAPTLTPPLSYWRFDQTAQIDVRRDEHHLLLPMIGRPPEERTIDHTPQR